MNDPDDAPSPSEVLLARLLAELDQVPHAGRAGVVDRYLREHPAQAASIRELVEVEAGVRPPAHREEVVPPRLEPGQRLGPFRVVRFVAQGGMGEVYEAVQDVLDRRVALKVIRRGFVGPAARARFLREQRVLARLHQTNIVPVHHAGEEGDLQYCAMQFLDGVSVHRVVTELYRRETSEPGGHTPLIREVVGSLVRTDTHPPADAPTAPAAPEPPAPAAPPAPLTLSPGYFASVAGVMAQVAEAVQHGHDRHVCHRDIKPSNLIIDADERCWVIDYGLAAAVNGAGGAPPAGGDADDPLTRGPLGTPQYMAPEQFDGRAESRSDVWGLGVTLYELLTLRPAFAGGGWSAVRDRVLRTDPPDPRALVRNVPADLVAICRQAMAKDPAARYPTAQAFADDLRRWLNWEPTTARPGWGTLRPLRLWAWRNKAWAAAAAAVLVALVGGLAYESARAARLEREQAVLKAQQLVLGERKAGWSQEAMTLLESANRAQPGDDVRDQAAATLAGLDAREAMPHYQVRKPSPDAVVGLSAVAFGPDGQHILAGGYRLSPALLWDENLARAPAESRQPGEGPVAFADADTPLQLVLPAGDRRDLLLWNVAKNEKVAELPLPLPGTGEETVAALSADARLAAASVTGTPDKDGKRAGVTVVWAVEPKRPGAAVKELARWDRPASALAFSPDGKYLADGTRDGAVGVRATADVKEVLTLAGDLPVNALAFGRNLRKTARDKPRLVAGGVPGWLLAAGTRGGTTTVWDLETRVTVNTLRGASHYINAVAFSPDGTTVVTAGHERPALWDVATGKPILHLAGRQFQAGVAISPDGRRVAVTSAAVLGDPTEQQAGLDLFDLDDGRGIRTYRGLAAAVQFVRLSPYGRWVAALAHNWELGVWDRTTGRLAYVWNMTPSGYSADNADLAFDEKEESVLFASGERAVRLNLTTGERTKSWSFPVGLMDNLVLRPGQPPLLLRAERNGPDGPWRPLARELSDEGTARATPLPIPGRIHTGNVFAGGRYLIVYPPGSGGDPYEFDGKTMKPLPLPAASPLEKPSPQFVTGDGKLLVVTDGGRQGATCVYRLPDMTLRAIHRGVRLSAIDDAGKLGVAIQGDGLPLFRVGEERPLVTFDARRPVSSRSHFLSVDGRYMFWGRYDGTVCVADVNQCLQQLAPFLGR